MIDRRYEVLAHLGQGGLGSSYLVEDTLLGRRVALKLLRRRRDAALLEQEFARLRGIVHPYLAEVYDLGTTGRDGDLRPYFTSRYVDGVPLDRFVVGRTFAELACALRSMLSALAFLHELGLLHGDVNPSNVIVDRKGEGHLIDLSCGRPIGSREEGVSGTRGFIANEVLQGAVVDRRADLFAVGVTLRTLLPLLREAAPPFVEAAVDRLSARRPELRPNDVAAACELLRFEAPPLWASVLPPRLIGRRAELAELVDRLQALRDDRAGPRATVIAGPAGIGRTRLLAELKGRAQLEVRVFEAMGPHRVAAMLDRVRGAEYGRATAADVPGLLSALDVPSVFLVDDVERLDAADHDLLTALLRSVSSRSRAWVVCVGEEPPLPGLDVLRLAPLTSDDVRAWVADRLPGRRDHERIHDASAGYPADIAALLASTAEGSSPEPSSDGTRPQHAHGRFLALPKPLRRGLLALAFAEGGPGRSLTPEIPAEHRDALLRLGLVRQEEGLLRLARPSDARRIVEASSPEERHEVLTALRGRLRTLDSPFAVADAIALALASEDVAAAEELVVVEGPRLVVEARIAVAALRPLIPRTTRADVLVAIAQAELAAGHPQRAISILARALRASPASRAAVHLAAGSAYQAIGALGRAKRALANALPHLTRDEERAAATQQLARVLLFAGEPSAARDVIEGALSSIPGEHRVHLLAELAIAYAYLGDDERARAALDAGFDLAPTDPRESVRLHAARAFCAFRAGRPRLAKEHYARALELAESRGYVDQVLKLTQNLATADHQLGEYASARRGYERALDLARALDLDTIHHNLEFNLARLLTDIGDFARARSVVERVRVRAESSGRGFLGMAALALEGELRYLEGDPREGAAILERAIGAFEKERATREVIEGKLMLAQIRTAGGQLQDAERILVSLDAALHDVPDLEAEFQTEHGRWALARGEIGEALRRLEAALHVVAPTERAPLRATILALLTQASIARGSGTLAERHRIEALATWERIAAPLPQELDQAFWDHPSRRVLPRTVTVASGSEHPDRAGRLERILEINKRINSTLDLDEVLETAMDAAIELSGAERGFLILREKGALRVAVARNVSKEALDKPELAFSRSISERVIAEDEAVFTTDAASDARFEAARSIHVKQLKAVGAVPIRSPNGTLGAIYVDRRGGHGRLHPGALELLSAFSDQVAIAISNARLHASLRQRTEELEHARARLEALLAAERRRSNELDTRLKNQRELIQHRYDYRSIVGASPALEAVFRKLDRVIESGVTVMITGESGTGKELVARAIHVNGPRAEKPFVAVNCGGIPNNLLEAELFGYRRGAFTGADRDHLGLFRSAHEGTIFLDEIGEMPLAMQVKLLRVLQERKVRAVGDTDDVPIDVRVVCATHRRLEDEVRAGRFREDLYYRLAVIDVALPPLRDRREDIPRLAEFFLNRFAETSGRRALALSTRAMDALLRHEFPGNVRELENVLLRASVLAEGSTIEAHHLELVTPDAPPPLRRRRLPPDEERARLLRRLSENGWNVQKAARDLGISRATLYRRLDELEIERPV